MNSLNDRDSTFKSYLDDSDLENVSISEVQRTQLLDGETVVQETPRVILYVPSSDRRREQLGILTITTFKLSFVCYNEDEIEDKYQNNNLLKKNECCLSSIDVIYQVGDKSKKKLIPGGNVGHKIKELLVICKNMRIFGFSFKHSDKDCGKAIANTLLHHAYPKRQSLLFTFDYKDDRAIQSKEAKETKSFVTREEWIKELQRTKCSLSWKVTDVNRNFDVSTHLPQYVVVPESIPDNNTIVVASRVFRNSGFPIWVWGTENASLVRMPELLPGVTDRYHENVLMEHVRKSHVTKKKQPMIADLSKDCPSVKDVQHSYHKLRNLCTPDTPRMFKDQDFKFYGSLDNTKWLQHVSTCLTKSSEFATHICDDYITVALQEDKGQDMNCVISSLVQLIADPYWRTRKGFQSLIQKEWIALAHPFAFRLGHILDPDTEPAFLFLLFLDCTWQLLNQFPDAFQFTETYLTTVWDSAHLTIFHTFIFNCEHDRVMNGKNTVLRSVWDWSRQFSEDNITLFNNPLYSKRTCQTMLKPSTGVAALDIWRQCYFRWLPNVEIYNGGRSQTELCNRFIADDISLLEYRLRNEDFGTGSVQNLKEDRVKILRTINCFYPFGYQTDGNSSSVSNDLLSGDVLETQSILNLNNY